MHNVPGWEVNGVEPNPMASEYARNELGLNVITGFLEDVEYPEEYFDVITLWHVLEHLSDPSRTLRRIHKLLKPDGLLVITTPNLNSFDAQIFGHCWIGYELPRHYYVFSLETLNDILQKAGFKLLGVRYIYGSHAAFMSSLRFWLRGQRFSPGMQSVIESIIFSSPFRVLTSPYFMIADRLKLSSAPTTFFAKVC
jgi:predicted SAM-dependent methyltransferase